MAARGARAAEPKCTRGSQSGIVVQPSADAYTICIGHKEGDSLVIDVVRGTSGKFNPQAVTKEYAALCREFRVHGHATLQQESAD